jgi:hypothetical protein
MHNEVQIVPGRARCLGQGRVPTRYELRFPAHWCPRPVGNPAEAALERGTIEWLNAQGMGLESAEREKLRKFECGKYGGYSLPTAPLSEALIVTQFISLWLFWDDIEIEEHTAWSIDDVACALTSGNAGGRGRYIAAWADLGRRLRERRDPAWLERLTASMRDWLENAKLETGLARKLRERGEWPELDTVFACRTVSIGMYPTFHLVELAEDIELPAAIHEHPVVKALKRTASRLVGMGNDLGGVAKDIVHGWLNLVLVAARSSSIGIEEAFGRVVELHNREVLEFDRTALTLPSFGNDLDPSVQRWVDAVRYSVHGFALWESVAERYQEYTATVEGRALVASVALLDVSPADAQPMDRHEAPLSVAAR